MKEENNKAKCYGKTSRNGLKFHDWLEKIKDLKLRNGTSKDRISTVKLTNAIVRWRGSETLQQELINVKEEELVNI